MGLLKDPKSKNIVFCLVYADGECDKRKRKPTLAYISETQDHKIMSLYSLLKTNVHNPWRRYRQHVCVSAGFG